VAIAMVMKSLEPGKYAAHQQFETIRKLRAAYSNAFMASLAGTNSLRTVGGDRAKYFLTVSPTQSLFFGQFSRGCLCHMGQIVKQDLAPPNTVIIPLLGRFKGETGKRYHLTPLAAVTSSGIQVKLWVKRLVDIKTSRGYARGLLFGDDHGVVIKAKTIEMELMERLQGIKDAEPGLIPTDLDVYEDLA